MQLRHALLDGFVRQVLEVEVETRVHGEAALLHGGRPVLVLQLAHHVVDEVRRSAGSGAPVKAQLGLDVLLRRLVGLRLADVPTGHHALEHVGLARLRALEMGLRVVVVGRVNQPGQKRGLADREVLGLLVAPEVGLGGRAQAICVVAVVDAVQVHVEDLVFGVALLQRGGQNGLLQLAEDRFLGREQLDLDQLLADRAAALLRGSAGQVGERGPDGGGHVDRPVVVEVAVLRGERGRGSVLAHVLEREHVVELAQRLTVAAVTHPAADGQHPAHAPPGPRRWRRGRSCASG